MRKRISGLMAFICLLVAAASALAAAVLLFKLFMKKGIDLQG